MYCLLYWTWCVQSERMERERKAVCLSFPAAAYGVLCVSTARYVAGDSRLCSLPCYLLRFFTFSLNSFSSSLTPSLATLTVCVFLASSDRGRFFSFSFSFFLFLSYPLSYIAMERKIFLQFSFTLSLSKRERENCS